MKKVYKVIRNWVLDRLVSGTAWDHFLLGLAGLVILVVASMLIGYVRS